MRYARIDKLSEALSIIRECVGKKGVWADPTRYRNQCWTRDFGIAIAPLLLQIGEYDIVRTHLYNLSALQRPNGQIPILFLDDEKAFVEEKERLSCERGRPSFMLKRYREGGLWNLTPGTRDSEIVYLVAMHEYAQASGDVRFLEEHRSQIIAARLYVENHLMRDGLVHGCDWRDTMDKELGDKPLLTNNCLLIRAYQSARLVVDHVEDLDFDVHRRYEDLFLRIRETHLTSSGTLLDFPGNERFDPLGASLAVLEDIGGADSYDQLVKSFRKIDSPFGVTIRCRHNPISEEEKEVIDRTDGVVVWPFIVGFTTLALLKMGEFTFAKEQFKKLVNLNGFYEWYDPLTGKGYGAQRQLWSAALYARAAFAMATLQAF